MNLHTLYILNPTLFSTSPKILINSSSNHCPRLVQGPVLTHGFSNSAKRVSKSLIKMSNHSCSTRISCDLGFNLDEGEFDNRHYSPKLVQDLILSYGFCNSAKRVSKSLAKKLSCSGSTRVKCGLGFNGDEGEYDDGYYMRRCVEIARKAVGCTSPNPMVGCVIVKDGEIVGVGFHPKAGQPHAEVFALRDAGDLAENSTAYVSLEPCNHYGRTPPCSEALIKAKVRKVVVGMVDPNPIVASKGVDKLRNAGIEVKVGVEEELCKKLNEAYIHQMIHGRPFITLRYSLTINGRFSNQLGEEVTMPGGYYSKLLQEYDSIIISSNSSKEKPTFPFSSEPGANQPLRIIIAKNSISDIQVPELSPDEVSKAIIFTDKEKVVEPETAQKGIETVVLDKISLLPILDYCKSRGSCSVLLDIRGNLEDFQAVLEEGYEQNLFQKVVVEMLPIWDESEGKKLPKALKNLENRIKLRSFTSRNSSKSVLLEGYF